MNNLGLSGVEWSGGPVEAEPSVLPWHASCSPSPQRGEGRGEGERPSFRIAEAAERQFPGYASLAFVLAEPLQQAAAGKGRARHTRDGATGISITPFGQQPICEIPRALGSLGLGFPLGQALKKIEEAALLLERGDLAVVSARRFAVPDNELPLISAPLRAAARAELLGAIVYTAAAVVLIEETPPSDLAAPGVPSPSPDVRERDGVRVESPSPQRGEGRGEGDAITGEGSAAPDPNAPLFRIAEAASREFPGYVHLAFVLAEALQQAAAGKGRDRHTRDGPAGLSPPPFEFQPICEIPRALGSLGLGFPLGQALKKIQEAALLHERGNHTAAVDELLGAIVYSASAVTILVTLPQADLAAPVAASPSPGLRERDGVRVP